MSKPSSEQNMLCENCGWTGDGKNIPRSNDQYGDQACPKCKFIRVLVAN